MIPGTHGLGRVIVDLSVLVPVGAFALFSFWEIENLVMKTTEFENIRVAGNGIVRAGEIVGVDYDIVRHRTCSLEIMRILRRESDGRDFVIQIVGQLIEKDRPPVPKPSGYRVQIPIEVVAGKYALFARTRYYCNGLDWIVPRIKSVLEVELEVVE